MWALIDTTVTQRGGKNKKPQKIKTQQGDHL